MFENARGSVFALAKNLLQATFPYLSAVIIKTDKYGKVAWSRFFASANTDPLAFSNIIALSNGDVVAYLTTQRSYPYYGKVICFASNGDIKWITILNTG